jgi:hypothetical protein
MVAERDAGGVGVTDRPVVVTADAGYLRQDPAEVSGAWTIVVAGVRTRACTMA